MFDRVLVLDHGRPIYFGPTGEAKQYFIDLGYDCEPRKSTPDFLTGITNPQERIVREGFKVPENSAELEEAYVGSANFQNALLELQEYEASIAAENPHVNFKEVVKQAKAKRANKKSVYSASIWEQLYALVVRSALLFLGDKLGIIIRYFSAIIMV